MIVICSQGMRETFSASDISGKYSAEYRERFAGMSEEFNTCKAFYCILSMWKLFPGMEMGAVCGSRSSWFGLIEDILVCDGG